MNSKKKFTLLLSASALSMALMLPGTDTSYALDGNDFDVNSAWTLSDNITTDYTVKSSGGGYGSGQSQIGKVGVTATFTMTPGRDKGASYLSRDGNNQAAYGAKASMLYGNPNPGSIPALGMNTQASSGVGGPLGSWEKYNSDGEYEVGSVTFKFDRKVTDPILDLSGLGGYVSRVGSYAYNGQMILVGMGSFNSTNLHLATEGITVEPLTSNSNLTVVNNVIQVKERNTYTRAEVDNGGYNWIQFYDAYGRLYQINSPALAPAGTGSVKLKGTFDEVTFKLYHQATPYSKFPKAQYGTHDAYFANHAGEDPSHGDGINGMNVINTESVQIGGQLFSGDQNWDLFRASLRLPKPSSIGDKVWLDEDKDGIQDAGEAGVAGVTVKLLDKEGKPAKDFNGNPVADQVTDENGNYKFDNLAAGEYTVEIVPNKGQKLTTKGDGTNAAADSDFDSDTKKTAPITLDPNTNLTDIDAGLVEEDTYKVVYKFEPSEAEGTPETLPEGVLKQLPKEKEDLEDGTEVPSPKEFTPVEDEVNGGTWSFEKWDKDSVTIDKDTIGEDRTEEVIGYWKFTPKTEYKVTHEFKSGTPNKELPDEVKALLPKDQPGKKDGTTVGPTQPEQKTVEVSDGTWTFTGYDRKQAVIAGKDENFVGTWEFTPKTTEYKVDYEFQPSKEVGTPSELPQGVKDQLPKAKEKLADGTEVPSPKDFTPVKDTVNKGTWTFEAWDKETATIKGADEHVTGTWKFTKDEEPQPGDYKVDYEFQPSKEPNTPSELPQGVKDQLPKPVENLEDGKSVPSPKDFTPVRDEANKGTWTFESWD